MSAPSTTQPLKSSLLKCLNEHSRNEGELLREVNLIAEKEGDLTFPVLLKLLTHLDFDPNDAREKWEAILAHRKKLNACLGRPVSLLTAICDYFCTIIKTFQTPTVIEMEIFEQTARSSHSDPLTGLYNRRYFDEALSGEINRSRRYGADFSLLFFDLDNFKRLNDSLGHQAGDMALKRVAEIILSKKRTEDVAARFGGEEIVLILPQTSKIKGLIIAERIRQEIEKAEMSIGGKTFHITASGGLAAFPLDARDARELVSCADKAMYGAKSKGKNNISVYLPDKRHFLRVDFFGEILVQNLGKTQAGELLAKSKNLSYGGLLFESKEPFNLGDSVNLRIVLSSSESPILLTGVVVRVESFDSRYDIGISFLELVGETNNEIAQYIAGHLNDQTGLQPPPGYGEPSEPLTIR